MKFYLEITDDPRTFQEKHASQKAYILRNDSLKSMFQENARETNINNKENKNKSITSK